MIGWLLHIANSNPVHKEDFYAMKQRVLNFLGTKDGLDIQHIPGKVCYGCDGTGDWYHTWSGDYGGQCDRCWGTGYWKRPVFVTLQRWRLGRWKFHQPTGRSYIRPDLPEEPKSQISGYIEHRKYPRWKVSAATVVLALISFHWRLAAKEADIQMESYRWYWRSKEVWRRPPRKEIQEDVPF